ncbi:unnamed protein product [Cylicostephanus goldi]|uniref:Nuclear receptor domain-containing protein n=1 Tax=Cylicostephanus goldi TaxID=71465 RepID=A0A3P6SQI3_CYLGO|nr:unnamed protein product [Cylicostephanus goldi]
MVYDHVGDVMLFSDVLSLMTNISPVVVEDIALLIEVTARCACRACRLAKCIAVGMDKKGTCCFISINIIVGFISLPRSSD